jgi:hypothetical protein
MIDINKVGTINAIRSRFIYRQYKKGIRIVKLRVAEDGIEIFDARPVTEICVNPLPTGGFVRVFDNNHFVVTDEKYQELIHKYNIK